MFGEGDVQDIPGTAALGHVCEVEDEEAVVVGVLADDSDGGSTSAGARGRVVYAHVD